MIRRALTAALLATTAVLTLAGTAQAHPVLDGPVTYCGPATHWSFGHCVPTVRPAAPGRHAI